ncbi:hypothetical protein BKA81DRAFT_343516 [Phyllosticta paracitricarpa]
MIPSKNPSDLSMFSGLYQSFVENDTFIPARGFRTGPIIASNLVQNPRTEGEKNSRRVHEQGRFSLNQHVVQFRLDPSLTQSASLKLQKSHLTFCQPGSTGHSASMLFRPLLFSSQHIVNVSFNELSVDMLKSGPSSEVSHRFRLNMPEARPLTRQSPSTMSQSWSWSGMTRWK